MNTFTAHKTLRPGVVRVEAALADFSFPAHSHDHICVGLVRHGALDCRYGRRRFDVEAGDLMLVNAGEIHDGRRLASCGRRYSMLEIAPEAMRAIGGDAIGAEPGEFPSAVVRDPEARDALAAWIRSLTAADPCAERDAAALLFGHLSVAPAPRPSVASELAVRAARRLREQSDSDGLAALATELGVSRYQLVRAFKRSFGLTPQDVRRQLRIERARASLRGDDDLARVALASGFADQSHMTREFRRLSGISPGAYRRALR